MGEGIVGRREVPGGRAPGSRGHGVHLVEGNHTLHAYKGRPRHGGSKDGKGLPKDSVRLSGCPETYPIIHGYRPYPVSSHLTVSPGD